MTWRAGARPATLVVVLAVAACGGGGDEGSATTDVVATTDAPRASTTTSSVTTSTTTDAPATSTTISSTRSTTTSSSTTSTTAVRTPACERERATAILDETVALARLAPAAPWTDDTDGVAFDARTDTGAEYARLQGFDCGLRLAQRLPGGDERLALIAWNDRRHALVVQATDPPTTPYATAVVFQLFLEQPYGEWMVDQFVWAATMSGGESIVLGADDTSLALAAKSWQADVPPWEDLPVTLDAERYGIDALRAAGARLVSVAEPAPYGSPIGSLQLHTPVALPAFAVVAPAEALDPMVPIVANGEHEYHDVAGVTVRVTTGEELPGIVLHEAGWQCGGYSWRLMSSWGSPGEILEFATLVVTTNCTPGGG